MGTRIETEYYCFVLREEIPPERIPEVTRELEKLYPPPGKPSPTGKKKLVFAD